MENLDQDNSGYKVPYTTILDIQPHNNADRLLVATVYGFQVIIPKDKYVVGSKIIYVPIDSILPENIEKILFPEDSKIKLHNHRVRQIRIRGLASQGMIVNPSELSSIINLDQIPLETDLSLFLSIKKYEPPEPEFKGANLGVSTSKKQKDSHPLFSKYGGVENIKWFPNKFDEQHEVIIEEKVHGTNARAYKLPFIANTFWKKIKKFLRMAPEFEIGYGSNNVDISAKSDYKGFYGEDVYGACFKEIDAFNKMQFGEIIFGEIIGKSIQKNYEYGLDGHKFLLFDVKIVDSNGSRWLNPEEVEKYAKDRGFEFVPVLYRGPFNRELAYSLTKGPSVFCPSQLVREGVVIKSRKEYDKNGQKQALKWVSEDYLADKNNTDFH